MLVQKFRDRVEKMVNTQIYVLYSIVLATYSTCAINNHLFTTAQVIVCQTFKINEMGADKSGLFV